MNKSWTLSLLFGVFFTTIFVVDCDKTSGAAITHNKECSAVHAHFLKHKLGHHNIIPEQKIHDGDMQICYKGSATSDDRKSCCTHKMEEKYSEEAQRHYSHILKSSSAVKQSLLRKNLKEYKEKVLHLLHLAEKNTLYWFSQMYKLSLPEHHGPIADFFKDLKSYVSLAEVKVNILDSVTSFFDKLFPHVYHDILNDSKDSNGLIDEYRECLSNVRQHIQPHPFGDIPRKLADELTRALSVSRLIMDTLKLGIKTLNKTDNLNLDPECVKALTRSKYCSHCDGHVTAKPCHGFCLNVMRGCLVLTTELDTPWNTLMDAFDSLVKNMRGSMDIEHVLKGMHTRVSEAVMHAMDTGPKFHGEVVSRCGFAKSISKSSKTTKSSTPDKKATLEVVLNLEAFDKVKLSQNVKLIASNMVSSKGYYHGLADSMCNADAYAVRAGHACWNGTAMSPYNKTVSPIGLNEQLNHNPEMRVMRGRHKVLITLMNDLIQMEKQMASKVGAEELQADQYSMARTTYYYSSGQGDDEDDGYSGSGSGHDERPRVVPPRKDDLSNDRNEYVANGSPSEGSSDSRKDLNSAGHQTTVPTHTIFIAVTSLLLTARWLNG